MNDPVGPVLRMGGEIDDVVAAIRDDNPDREIETIDRGSYVRVQTSTRMRLSLETLRVYLGPSYELALFSSMMPSFVGRMVTSSDELIWESIKTPRTDTAGAEEKNAEELV
ncbi:MmoB/DmpM family protein [Nocardia miyunensis]|uniref:MmoB/DmpM family protein n=1 Tax=Nocardia miyunensis TaxID=282684 RepID=UPI00083151B0|nr:MmoB/DmpM family protein [Nocardia miyunensis]